MPEGSALGNVDNSVFKTRGSDLAYQFLEGVRFMHQHNVAHLDLKPNNIIVMATTNSAWLCIIDFGVSVWVPEQESFIEGYRGMAGWMAPELEVQGISQFGQTFGLWGPTTSPDSAV